MNRRLLILNGFAILNVVFNHAAFWGQAAIIRWTNQVGALSSSWVGSPSYYVLSILKTLDNFAVPAFLFTSGIFIAYALRDRSPAACWKIVSKRVIGLFIPYFIWSIAFFFIDGLIDGRKTFLYYFYAIIYKGAVAPYYFVPLLCFLYFSSILIVSFAVKKPLLLLIIAAMIQLTAIGMRYLAFSEVKLSWGGEIGYLIPDWSLPNLALFFVLGIVYSLYGERFQTSIRRIKWILLAGTIVLAVLHIIEIEAAFRLQHFDLFPNTTASTITRSLYGLSCIVCYLAFDRLSFPASRALSQIGARTFGIYLLHHLLILTVDKIVSRFAPSLMGYLWLYPPVLFVAGLGGSLLLMDLVARSPARRYYRFLFG